MGDVDALVTDAHSRAGVAGIRALGRAGLRVVALAGSRGAAGLRSRYPRGGAALRSRYTSVGAVGPPAGEGAPFMARIGELARAHGPLVVFPGQEQALDPLADHMHELPPRRSVPI